MTFGEQVGDLFHLQRAFESDRKIALPPEKQHSAHIDVLLRDRFDLIARVENLLDLLGQSFERVE